MKQKQIQQLLADMAAANRAVIHAHNLAMNEKNKGDWHRAYCETRAAWAMVERLGVIEDAVTIVRYPDFLEPLDAGAPVRYRAVKIEYTIPVAGGDATLPAPAQITGVIRYDGPTTAHFETRLQTGGYVEPVLSEDDAAVVWRFAYLVLRGWAIA